MQSGTAADGLASGYGLGLRLVPGGSGVRVGHTGSMPGFQACLLVDRPRRTGVVVLANSTTGLRPDTIATRLLDTLEAAEPTLADVWRALAARAPGGGRGAGRLVLGEHAAAVPLGRRRGCRWARSRVAGPRPSASGTAC